jgi:excisionase family DNA binding protein
MSRIGGGNALIRVMKQMSANRQEDRVVNQGEGEEAIGMVVPMLLTIPDAARVLAIGRTTLYELIADGALEVVRIGRCARVPLDALQTFVDQRRPGR